MYRVTYGDKLLHDVRSDIVRLGDLSLDQNVDECGFCQFTIYPNHPMHGKLVELDTRNLIRVYFDKDILFQGFIYELGKDFQICGTVKCKGDLAFLEDSVVRPYSTVKGVYKTQAPPEVDGYFRWLIEQHNNQSDSSKHFVVGINDAGLLDKNNYVFRESKKLPSTLSELREKMLNNNNLGGHIRVRYPDGIRTIDYLAEFYDINAQVFDFGVNLTDYMETDDALDVYTAIIPTGKTRDALEGEDRDRILPLGIENLPDGIYTKDPDYYKMGDMIYSIKSSKKYGFKVTTYSNEDITDEKMLLDAGVMALKSSVSPKKTIEIKAVDLSLINKDFKPLKIGEYVRVRSRPHNFDSYMLCSNIEPDLNNPENSIYTLGTTFDTLTGQQDKRINELNATINKNYEVAKSLTEEAKQTAEQAKTTADTAIKKSVDEYVLSESYYVAPTTGWSERTPEWNDDRFYIWRRTKNTYGDNSVAYGAPAVMSGNTGKDAILLRIDSSRGIVFKNSGVSTTLTVRIFYGDLKIENPTALNAAFGPGARLEWSWLRKDENVFGIISASDPRLSNGGFSFILSPADVDVKTTFACDLTF